MSASHSPCSTAPSVPLDRIASTLANVPDIDPDPCLVYLDATRANDRVDIGLWPIPRHGAHPLDSVVGFRAPANWDAVGFLSGATARHLDVPGPEATDGHSNVAVLAHRDGRVVSAIGSPGRDPLVISEPPLGWAADVLARVLGRPTPPPDQGVGELFEHVWLHRLASTLLRHPGRADGWRYLADRHPLRGTGPLPSPADLAERCAHADHCGRQAWEAHRRAQTGLVLPASVHGPSGGTTLDAETWFDDGSFSRWMFRTLPPVDEVALDLVEVLSSGLGDDLLRALANLPGR